MHHDPAQYDHHVSSTGAPSATVFRMPFARESTGSSHALLPSFPLDGLVIDGRRLSAEDSVTTFAQSNAASFKFSQPPSHLQGHELTLVAPPDAMPHDHRLSSASYWGVHQLDETQGDAGDWPADAGVFAFNRDFFEATQDEQHVHLGEYEYSDSASARTHSRAGTASTSDSSWSPLVGRQQLHGPAESVADAGHSWPHSLASSPLPSPLDPMPDAAVSEPFHIGSSAFFTTPSSAIDTTPNLGMTATPMPTSIATMSGDAATGPLSIPVLSSANLAAAEAFHSQSEAVSLPPATSPFGSWTPPPALSHLGLTDAQRIRGSDATVRPLGRQGSIAHSLMSRPSDAGLPGSQRYSRQRLPSRAFLDCIETGLLEHEGEPESPQAISQEPTYLFLSPDQAHNAQLVQQILKCACSCLPSGLVTMLTRDPVLALALRMTRSRPASPRRHSHQPSPSQHDHDNAFHASCAPMLSGVQADPLNHLVGVQASGRNQYRTASFSVLSLSRLCLRRPHLANQFQRSINQYHKPSVSVRAAKAIQLSDEYGETV